MSRQLSYRRKHGQTENLCNHLATIIRHSGKRFLTYFIQCDSNDVKTMSYQRRCDVTSTLIRRCCTDVCLLSGTYCVGEQRRVKTSLPILWFGVKPSLSFMMWQFIFSTVR